MIEINVKGVVDGLAVREAIAAALDLPPEAVLPIDDYWDVDTSRDTIGVEVSNDIAWTLVTLHRNPEPLEENEALGRAMALRLGVPCAVFDMRIAREQPGLESIVFFPDGTRRRGYGVEPTRGAEGFAICLSDGTPV